MTKKLIPFDWDKYQAGYKAVRKDGCEILYVGKSECSDIIWPIVYLVRYANGVIDFWRTHLNGIESSINSINYLFLETKTIDLWIGLSKELAYRLTMHGEGIACTPSAYINENSIDADDLIRIKITIDTQTLKQVL